MTVTALCWAVHIRSTCKTLYQSHRPAIVNSFTSCVNVTMMLRIMRVSIATGLRLISGQQITSERVILYLECTPFADCPQDTESRLSSLSLTWFSTWFSAAMKKTTVEGGSKGEGAQWRLSDHGYISGPNGSFLDVSRIGRLC